ncbi:MAG: DUF2384 domain-containing protein [Firmicutes bacterium]|nr:DUF2384 domain-containing protein [Bacillota bacterium]
MVLLNDTTGVIIDFEKKKVEIRFKTLTEHLVAYANRPEFGPLVSRAFERFVSDPFGQDRDEPDEESEIFENEFLEWFILDYVDEETGMQLVRSYLSTLPDGPIDRWKRSALAQWADSRLGVYEVERVVSNDRLVLRDVVEGGEFVVTAQGVGEDILRWSGVMTRLLSVGDHFTVGATALVIPRPLLKHIVRVVGHVFRSLKAQDYEGEWADFLKISTLSLRRLVRIMLEAWSEQCENSSGRPRGSAIHKMVMMLTDPVAATGILRECGLFYVRQINGLDRLNGVEAEFGWVNPPGETDASGAAPYGAEDAALVCVLGPSLVIMAGSQRALRHCAAAVRGVIGPLVDPSTVPRRIPWDPKAMDAARQQIAEIARLAIAEHYRRWADTPLTVLRGSSPRDAMKSGFGQAIVEELLKDIEYHESLKRRAGMPWVDVESVRRGLMPREGKAIAPREKAGQLGLKEKKVQRLLEAMMRREGYTEEQIYAAMLMWWRYVDRARPNVVHANTWAAAVEYASAVSLDEPITQAGVARKYQVSVSTLSSRYRQILREVGV